MDLFAKLSILGEAARYDVSCSSSGVQRSGSTRGPGNAVSAGICHTWTEDGRCVSLLKVLLTNRCIYDCAYCANRASNERPRAAFTAEELAELTISFYRRNYIEGLFLSSGVWPGPDAVMENMIRTLAILRRQYSFSGYVHAKAIPGSAPELLEKLGFLADRVSVNIEQCTRASLEYLAPQKTVQMIAAPMRFLTARLKDNRDELVHYRHAQQFAPAGQTTQIIVGVSPEKDLQILNTAQHLYDAYNLKRVYYSAYIPINKDPRLPATVKSPPLLREHRLYQADWLLRFYRFSARELVHEQRPDLDLDLDPKCSWALRHLDRFPVEINKADYDTLLRVPGIGVKSARRIISARRYARLSSDDLRRMRIVMKRAAWFLTCDGRYCAPDVPSAENLQLMLADSVGHRHRFMQQVSLEEIYGNTL